MSVLNQLLNRQSQQNSGIPPGTQAGQFPSVGISGDPKEQLLQKLALLSEVMKFKKPQGQPQRMPQMQMPGLPQMAQRSGAGQQSSAGMLSNLANMAVNKTKMAELVKARIEKEKMVARENEKQQKLGLFQKKILDVSNSLGGKNLTLSTFLKIGSELGVSPVDTMKLYNTFADSKKKIEEAKAVSEKNKPDAEARYKEAVYTNLLNGKPLTLEQKAAIGIKPEAQKEDSKVGKKLDYLYDRLKSLKEQKAGGVNALGRPINADLINREIWQTEYDVEAASNSGYDPSGNLNPGKIISSAHKGLAMLLKDEGLPPEAINNIIIEELPNWKSVDDVKSYLIEIKRGKDEEKAAKLQESRAQAEKNKLKKRAKAAKAKTSVAKNKELSYGTVGENIQDAIPPFSKIKDVLGYTWPGKN
jgi:hypothetical protein